jgi:hypothetical protein
VFGKGGELLDRRRLVDLLEAKRLKVDFFRRILEGGQKSPALALRAPAGFEAQEQTTEPLVRPVR